MRSKENIISNKYVIGKRFQVRLFLCTKVPAVLNSVAGIATRYGLKGPGI